MRKNESVSRRNFIKTTGLATAGGAIALNMGLSNPSLGKGSDTLKVGLIGCGGRGSGAANQALNADPNVVLTAMADIFEDRLEESYANLKKIHPDKVKVSKKNKFVGFDAYQKVLESGVDVVLLAAPPAFRPEHFMASVKAGKHVFTEKPMAVDAPGIRKTQEAARLAKEKSLSVVAGYCWRFHYPKREIMKRIHEGQIGDVNCIYASQNADLYWHRDRKPGWSDNEYNMRNWGRFNWISGDMIAEFAVHTLDLLSWAMGDKAPIKATGTGGRQVYQDGVIGNNFDHFAVMFEYENGAKGFHFSRRQNDCDRSYGLDIVGTKGQALIDCSRNKHKITGPEKWRFKGEDNEMYQTEHDELFAAIRKGEPINDGDWMCNSTMLAILGRLVAYTGKTITWEEALNSEEVFGPPTESYSWDMKWPDIKEAQPGITKFY
ncbi:Gfo/Idh/MocA family oxidoreductase [Rapidithrix thailandica]|uniref:Gfo/Idh/MocA family oxidoreductase n=1 Tax=Rapidithrix thailandica TaxID=413964 RepID=A0AAW9S3C5_9BACT